MSFMQISFIHGGLEKCSYLMRRAGQVFLLILVEVSLSHHLPLELRDKA